MPERKGGSAELGLRERGKRARLRRIKEAAHEAFRTQGYNGASTREIAKQADVSIGTLFVYAQDKRDLLFLVLNEDLDPLFRQALSGVLSEAPVLDQLVSLLRPIYEYFAAEPELARASLREMGHFDPRSPEAGKQTKRYNDRMTGWRDALAAILLRTKKSHGLKVGNDYRLLANALFDVHLGAVRGWLQDEKPELERGIDSLKALFRVVIGER